MRLDILLTEKYGIASRNKASELIKAGSIEADGSVRDKPSYEVRDGGSVKIIKQASFATVGGDKLQKALTDFALSVKNAVCIDVGAAEGGFTDCLLKNGVKKVYAVDVGECALPQSLRGDPRVIIKDKTNARYITGSDIGEKADLITVDVSFISLKHIFPAVSALLKENARIIALIKPQFECGKSALSKRGIVTEESNRKKAIQQVLGYAEENGLKHRGLTTAPIVKGKNIEYLALLTICPCAY